jgi:hypothetical protein
MRTEDDFLIDVLGRLSQAGIDYMLARSMASNFWGIPRTTRQSPGYRLQLHAQDGATSGRRL